MNSISESQLDQLSMSLRVDAAFKHHRRGDHESAERLYREIIEAQPGNAEVLHYAGLLALETARFDLAVERLTLSIRCGRNDARTHMLLGRAQKGAGHVADAVASYRRALVLDASLVDAHVSLGIALRSSGMVEEAARSYHAALAVNPRSFEAHLNLGNLLQAAGRLEEAVAHYDQAGRLRPDSADLHYESGATLARLGRKSEAAARLNRAIVCDQDMLKAYGSLGELLNAMKQHEAALAFFRLLIERIDAGKGRPQAAESRQQLRREAIFGCIDALLGASRYDEAIEEIQSALRGEPRSVELLDRLLLAAPYRFTSQDEIVAASRRFQEVSPFGGVRPRQAGLRDQEPERLRIGYVSADFRNHSVAYFIEPLLACHDRSRFAVHCYSSNVKDDEVTTRMRGYADDWIEARSLTDAQLAERIAADKIDVLVDLSGRTEGCRPWGFVDRPATLQLTYLGFPTFTGFPQLDLRITDAIIDPKDAIADGLSSEQALRLPRSMFCYRPPSQAPEPSAPTRAPGPIRFGSFNQALKLSPHILRAWAEILARVPESLLILKSYAFDDETARRQVRDAFARAGGDARRLETRGAYSDKLEHLAAYHEIDVALDTFPYNGATTTCEALWMGVPVVTLAGQTHASRMGASLLGAMRLEQLVTRSFGEYIDMATALAGNPDGRAELRGGLRERFRRSELRDESGFVRDFEETVRGAWRARWNASGEGQKS